MWISLWITLVNKEYLSTTYKQNVHKYTGNVYSIYKGRCPKNGRKSMNDSIFVSCEKCDCEIVDKNRMDCVSSYYNA
jgi:hypothetical protein